MRRIVAGIILALTLAAALSTAACGGREAAPASSTTPTASSAATEQGTVHYVSAPKAVQPAAGKASGTASRALECPL